MTLRSPFKNEGFVLASADIFGTIATRNLVFIYYHKNALTTVKETKSESTSVGILCSLVRRTLLEIVTED